MNISGDTGAKKILELNKDKILNLELNDQSITKGFDTQDNFNSLYQFIKAYFVETYLWPNVSATAL